MHTPLSILKEYWNFTAFRPQQDEIIQSVLQKKDTIALLPTGGGKSVCYQIPALMNEGLCLVISPLITLMKDQVYHLEKKGIPALWLHNGQTFHEVKKTLELAVKGDFKFLYLSPERLQSNLFREYLPGLNINLLAVDEAHCISQWGYDFRPSYLKIASIKEFTEAPLIALTASATPPVVEDIKVKLKLRQPVIFRQPTHRFNLSYSVFRVDSKINKVIDILNNVGGSSIIYCKSRMLAKKVSGILQLQNIDADFYHAGLSYEERNKKQEAWISNKKRVMVCTNAFGMGIDKPDVRTVIHFNVPANLESYYQESGRAGRDEKKSYAVLLYNDEDENDLKNLPSSCFPPVKEMKRIYQCLADYLSIPVGIGEGNFYNFNIIEFISNFRLNAPVVVSTLKILEQQDFLSFNETVFIPSKICFTASKEALTGFEETYPEYEALVKCLLRTYEGIYDNKVAISEKQVARLLKSAPDKVKQKLIQLRTFGIIEYEEQKDTPQVYFITNRAPAAYLNINYEKYILRKNEFTHRLETMQGYLTTAGCRSRFIGKYFGDEEPKPCGICDNCLKKKTIEINAEEFIKIKNHIFNLLNDENKYVKNILELSKEIKKEKLWVVLDFLQSEKIIRVENDGCIYKL